MYRYIDQYFFYLQAERDASPNTLEGYRRDLFDGLDFFCRELGSNDHELEPGAINHLLLRRYLAHLKARGLARSTVARRLTAWRSLYRYLCREGVVPSNQIGRAHV